ncbi:AAA family ATPase [Macrococcus lamae]|uniref:Nicotinamide-nucleotide adenylyltransferase n=1 Tax=Macrococcus lamae TaxID=198484 RepID=A0A4R6BT90_9STAP|nr:AAA family ATPase [Macrococcus lamae]TDM07690.1 hypothetical protein ERX29_08080 [Macrococcus lamae]
MRDLGIYFGTFAPCHVGHFEQIVRAKRENLRALVVVSGYEGDRGDKAGMSLVNRTKSMRELLRDDDNVTVAKLDETNIPKYPAGWQPWLELLQSHIETSAAEFTTVTFYVGEEEYIEPLQTYFNAAWPERDVLITRVDRRITGISGTSIRENPIFNWDYVTRPFRRYFVQNILIIGTASTGKTTLTRDLARRYSTSYSLEYSREYQTERQVKDDELDIKDLQAIGIGQYEVNREHIHSPGTRKVFFADTDVMTTKLYSKIYLSEEDYAKIAPVFDFYISQQTWALILLLPPTTTYVDDGFRDMSQADVESRNKMHQMFLDELEQKGLMERTVVLQGESFQKKYEEAHRLIDELLAEGKDN